MPAPANTDGVTLLPAITGKGKQQEGLIYSEYFEPGKSPNYKEFAALNRMKQRRQMQMIRMGDMVGLRYDIKSADDDFAIFNVLNDTHEAANLAATMPGLEKAMKEKVLQVRRMDTSARRPYDDALIPASFPANVTLGVNWKAFNGNFPWIPETSTLNAAASGKSNMPDMAEVKSPGHNVYLFEGYIKVPEDGDYTFYLSATGKAFMRLHQAILIDADYAYVPGTEKESTMKLKAGMHPFKLYYSGKPNGVINLQWKGESFAKSPIPASVFYR